MSRKELRTVLQVWEDSLWPRGGGVSDPDPFQDLRHVAIAHVLCRIPKEDYETLKSIAFSFDWFIPHPRELGKVYPFTLNTDEEKLESGVTLAAYAKVLFLNPTLERRNLDIAVAVVSHELAHLVLGHELFCDSKTYEAQEKEAWDLVSKWGFGKEAKKHEAMSRNYEASDKRTMKRIMARERSKGRRAPRNRGR